MAIISISKKAVFAMHGNVSLNYSWAKLVTQLYSQLDLSRSFSLLVVLF